jgi:hypothetical protein
MKIFTKYTNIALLFKISLVEVELPDCAAKQKYITWLCCFAKETSANSPLTKVFTV